LSSTLVSIPVTISHPQRTFLLLNKALVYFRNMLMAHGSRNLCMHACTCLQHSHSMRYATGGSTQHEVCCKQQKQQQQHTA
jgi:hypothetical protein